MGRRLQRTMGLSKARESLRQPADPCIRCALRRPRLLGHARGRSERVWRVPRPRNDPGGADALRISKRAFDAPLEQPTSAAVLESEERGQMLVILRVGAAVQRAASTEGQADRACRVTHWVTPAASPMQLGGVENSPWRAMRRARSA